MTVEFDKSFERSIDRLKNTAILPKIEKIILKIEQEDKKMKNLTDFDDLLVAKYGEKGTPSRDKFDADSLAFRLGVMLKEARKEAHITQEEYAERTGMSI